jgi:hypothetical protein
MFKNMNCNKGNKGNKRHLFRKLGIYDKIGSTLTTRSEGGQGLLSIFT